MAVDKLVDSGQLDSDLEDIADAIRAKGGTSAQLAFPSGFVSAIENIPSGGGTTWETVYQGTIYCSSEWGETTYVKYLELTEDIPYNSVWRVTWDGNVYECTATWAGHPNGNPYAIGNYTYEEGGSGGTEFPFFVQRYWGNTWCIVGTYGSHTVLFEKQVSGGATLITKTITANGTYDAEDDDADGYSSVTVNVSGGGGLVYETGTYTPASDTARPTISFQNSHTTVPILVMISYTSNAVESANTNLMFCLDNFYGLTGYGVYGSSSSVTYARTSYTYKSSSSISNGGASISSLTSSSATSVSEMGYYATTEHFYPYTGATTRYWRANKTYKWIAVWAPTT